MNRLSRGVAIVAMAVVAVAVSAPTVEAQTGGGTRSHSFDGTCSLSGIVTFDPPATIYQQLLHVDYRAEGTCSGTLDGRHLTDEPVRVHNKVVSDGSCLHAQTVESGRGAFRFDDGTTVAYTFEFTYVGTDGVISFRGDQSGSAVGHGSFITPDSSPEGAQACYNGEGVAQASMTIDLATLGAMASGGHSLARRSWGGPVGV